MNDFFDMDEFEEHTRQVELRQRRERIRRRRRVRRQRRMIRRGAGLFILLALIVGIASVIFGHDEKNTGNSAVVTGNGEDADEWMTVSKNVTYELFFPEKLTAVTNGKAGLLQTSSDHQAAQEEKIRLEKEQKEKERIASLENGGYFWASPKGAVDGKDFYYMERPQDDPALQEEKGKVIYLTFDDGPSDYTSDLLDFLDKYPEVKVTFFVVGLRNDHYDQIGRAAKAGHSIAVHSFSHDFKNIYQCSENYWEDFEKMQKVIEEQTGYRSQLMRFPGGSSNSTSAPVCQGIMTKLTNEANEKGYTYVDWNNASNDAGMTTDPNQEIAYIKQLLSDTTPNVVLNHDSKDYTVKAMKTFIPWALENGYTFLPMSPRSFASHHTVVN